MIDLLHVGALGLTACGTACVAMDRAHGHAPELAVAVLMFAGMIDGGMLHVVSPVLWAAVMFVAAICLAASRRWRPAPASAHGTAVAGPLTLHMASGSVVMGALQVVMAGGNVGGMEPASAHVHAAALLPAALLLGSVTYAGLSVFLTTRTSSGAGCAGVAAMGGSVALMATSLLG